MKVDALVIGAGPAGLMAAQTLALAGRKVLIAEAKPSVARKFLMAGKSGLNLTKAEDFDEFCDAFRPRASLRPMLQDFGPDQIWKFADALGQPLFTGSSGRVFPKAMKASPLLRAWLSQLSELNVTIQTRWKWQGFEGDDAIFATPTGTANVQAAATVLAMGGASWSRLGSDGAWADALDQMDVALTPFRPANMGFRVNWSDHMAAFFGSPVKSVSILGTRGEFVISANGVEGGGIYAASTQVRDGAKLMVDLLPDLSVHDIVTRLQKPRGKNSLTNHLRKVLNLDRTKLALLNECGRPLPQDLEMLAAVLKSLPIPTLEPMPMDGAISTAGGVAWSALTPELILKSHPGVFCAGEMLDWEAPTGGYLITGCMATGQWAGKHAADYGRSIAR